MILLRMRDTWWIPVAAWVLALFGFVASNDWRWLTATLFATLGAMFWDMLRGGEHNDR